MPLPPGVRRRLPRGGKARTTFVDLWPAHKDGDLIQGFIRVPDYLVGTKEHTNERLEFLKIIEGNLKTWVEWKAKQGWRITNTPSVAGPFDPPTEKQGAGPLDAAYPPHKRFVVTARFTRDEPQWIPFEGALWLRDQADMYGIDFRDSGLPDTGVGETKDEIIDNEPAHNPMEYAEARRQRLGLKRADFLLDDLEAPL
jgi:hypothetical protein